MSHAIVLSRAGTGLSAPLVSVEAHLSNGLPAFSVVGLPESSVREARERVRSALICSHFKWPDRRITVSLAPAEIPKSGGRFDLPIALAILVASGQLAEKYTAKREFFGELGLDGSLRSCRGLLTAVQAATTANRPLLLPAEQARDMAIVPGSRVTGAADLLEACGFLKTGELPLAKTEVQPPVIPPAPAIDDVMGQVLAKRALEIAASGGHHMLMTGPPGAGKTLLASCLPSLLGEPSAKVALELTLVRDLLGLDREIGRPFRAPHHSTTPAGLIGGGQTPLPGEASLAHGGVLFLDELSEYPATVLDVLRQPLESGEICISRARGLYRYPAQFQLVAAMNPCPCGYAGVDGGDCQCSTATVLRYQGRVSGPLLDRIDLHVNLERQAAATLLESRGAGSSAIKIRARINAAQVRQIKRQGKLNAHLAGSELVDYCGIDNPVRNWFEGACDRLHLTGRGIHKTLRIARTLADICGEPLVGEALLLEALGYRSRLSQ